MVRSGQPFVLLMHIPIFFPGLAWGPEDVMGHPNWGTASDRNAEVERRRKWPTQASPSTAIFIEAVKSAAETKQLLAVLTGHTHRDAVVPVPCKSQTGPSIQRTCTTQVRQFTTRPNFAGGARLFLIRSGSSHHPSAALAPAGRLRLPDRTYSTLACALLSLVLLGAYVACARPQAPAEVREVLMSEQGMPVRQ